MWLRRSLTALVAALLFGSISALPAAAQTTQAFTLAPNGRATITFEAFCMDFGGAFPAALQAPNGLASNDLRGGLAYIQANGISGQGAKALQAQYGLWRLAGAQGAPNGDATADAVVNARGSVPQPPANATSLLDAANNNQVALQITSWVPAGQAVEITPGSSDHFYGRGTLVLRNTTNQQLSLYMPIGVIFQPAASGSQRVIAYQTAVQVTGGTLPNTAALDARPLAALLALALMLPIHVWRKRRARLIGTRRAV